MVKGDDAKNLSLKIHSGKKIDGVTVCRKNGLQYLHIIAQI